MTNENSRRPVKICFVALGILPCIDRNSTGGSVGGAEVQQAAFGRALAARGFDVSFLTFDDLTEASQVEKPFEVYPVYSRHQGIPGLRFLLTRLPRTWAALHRINADLFYVRGASNLVGIVAAFCRRHRRRLIFSAASDADFLPRETRLKYGRDRLLFRFGLRNSDAIVCQSTRQKSALWENYGLDATVVPNIVPRVARDAGVKRDIILWVANLRGLKQPDHFIELARSLPDERFVMIGGSVDSERKTFGRTLADASGVPNLDFLGRLNFEETEAYFDRAKVFVNTSYSEGFPNTFLQAWIRGIPVVSYLDPDGLIDDFGLGYRVETIGQLKNAVMQSAQWDETSANRISEFCQQRFLSQPVDLLETLARRLVTN